jgi:hypothetical protein
MPNIPLARRLSQRFINEMADNICPKCTLPTVSSLRGMPHKRKSRRKLKRFANISLSCPNHGPDVISTPDV